MSIDKYLTRVYHPKTYNCAHLVAEVWTDLYGSEMGQIMRGFLCAKNDRRVRLGDVRGVVVLEKPEDPCVVLMHTPKRAAHVGVYLRGRVLHIDRYKGPQFVPLEVVSVGYSKVRFFKC